MPRRHKNNHRRLRDGKAAFHESNLDLSGRKGRIRGTKVIGQDCGGGQDSTGPRTRCGQGVQNIRRPGTEVDFLVIIYRELCLHGIFVGTNLLLLPILLRTVHLLGFCLRPVSEGLDTSSSLPTNPPSFVECFLI
jgi:hypothetical protein